MDPEHRVLDSPIVQVILTAMLPVGELRVALPLALTHYGMSVPLAYALTVFGNMLPIVVIVFWLDPVQEFLSARSKLFKRFFSWLFERTRRKHSKRFETVEGVALMTFVAIPLPMTGAWSGALAAFVFGIPPRKSLPMILLGVMIAGVIVAALTLGVVHIF